MKKFIGWVAEALLAIAVISTFLYFGLKTSPLYGW